MDLEDTYRSNEDEISYQIDPIRNISSKKWLNSAGVSLANLNQIQASVYNIGLVDAKNLRAPSSLSREKRSGSYGDISATPPLSTVSLQKTCNTWGSNNSIPDLIKQHVQADGTKLQRPESAKYNSVRRQRPSSGKKTRPQSATTHESQLPPKPPGIAVKGSKCDPAGRPLKYSPQQSVNTGWVGPPAGMKFPDNPSQDLSRILTSEPSSPPPPPQGTPAPPIGTPGPPSAPRASPIPIPFGDDGEDESVQTNENSVPEFKYTKGNPQVSPILLRKPTPEPIHLSLPTMEDEEVDEEQEENMNTDRLLELAEEKSSLLTRADIHSTNSDNLVMFNEKTDSLETASHNSAYHQNHMISTDEDHMVIESDGDWSVDEEVEDQPHPLSKSTVTFCEDNNVTIDITPRNMGYKVNDGPNQSKPKKPSVQNETKELQLDLNSLLTVTGTENTSDNKDDINSKTENIDNISSTTGNDANKKNAYRNLQKSSAQKLRASSASKHYSARYASHMEKCEKIYGMNHKPFSSFKPPKNRPVTPITMVTVDYGEKEVAEKKVKKKKKEKDIVTLVQQVSMSDSEEDKGDNPNEVEDVELTADLLQPWAPTKQISGPVKNHHELSHQKMTQPTSQSKGEVNEQPVVYKTTKTIEFDDEMPRETSMKSVIHPVVQNVKERSNENLKRPPSRPTSAKVTKKPPVSGACSNDQDRPGSRLGFVPMSPEKDASKCEDETQPNNKKAFKRPVSASTNQKRPVLATSNQKRPVSSHSKETPEIDNVSSPSLAAEPPERNITEIKQVEIKDPREIEIDRLIQKHLKRPPTTFKPTIDVFASDLVSDSEDKSDIFLDSNTTAIPSNLTAGNMSPKCNHDVTTVSDETSHDVTSTLSPKTSPTKSTTAKNKTSTKTKEVSNITLHLDDKVKTLVSDSCSGHKHYASYSRCRSAPTQRKTTQVKEKIRYTKPYYINTLKQYEDDLDTEEGRECALLQAKLATTGINVKAETLQRALYPPAGNSRYYEISAYLPKSQSLGLLSHPKVWLPVEYKQLKLAEKNLEKVNEIMRKQKLQEAKEARLAELAAKGESGTKKKKGKKGKGKKKVKKRRNSVS